MASLIEADGSGDIDALWSEHESTRKEFQDLYREILERSSFGKSFFNKNPKDLSTQRTINLTINKKPSFSFLDLKIRIAEKLFEDCVLCENRCHVDRRSERGVCGVGSSRVASEFMHMGEEPQLVPSHTIFFTGCSFKCVYCQNWDISQHPEGGMSIPEEELAAIIDKRRRQGSRNVNFVGGEPTPNLPYILKTMKLTRENIPVVWNSNFYMSKGSMKRHGQQEASDCSDTQKIRASICI
ncbi:MAG: radical SAM protein [Methanobacterium paludis]|nr:radical SAM protein [Methanobacterium paludis]